jgi:hypothetical protein
MSPVRVVVSVVLRSLVLTVVVGALGAVVSRGDSTDALGAGLLAFALVVVVSGVWGLVDGWRHGFLVTVLVWFVTAVLAGVAITLVLLTLSSTTDSLSDELSGGVALFGTLVFLPALVGAALGGLVHRVRGHHPAEAPVGAPVG